MSQPFNYVRHGAGIGVSTYQYQSETLDNLLSSVDLRTSNKFPPVFDQNPLNSCTANTVAAILYYDMKRQGLSDIFIPSRLFIYYNERGIEGTINQNANVSMRHCIETISKMGYCKEETWPYNTAKYKDRPPSSAYDFASKHKALNVATLSANLDRLKGCLQEGNPFVFGFKVFESFQSAAVVSNGVVPMPAAGEKELGAHAVVAVGYDDEKQHIIFRNSFGLLWGDTGYGYLPYKYFTSDDDLVFDFWVISKVTENALPATDSQSKNKGCMGVFLSIFF